RVCTLRATGAAGNGTEVSRTFAIDTIAPPAPHIEAPANGTALTSAPITFRGTAPEAGFVSIFEGSTLRGRVQVAGDGSWQLDVPATDGPHTYDAELEDAAGNFS